MIAKAETPPYDAFKLYRMTEWDTYELRGRLNGKWRRIYTCGDDAQARAVVISGYGIDICAIPHVTGRSET